MAKATSPAAQAPAAQAPKPTGGFMALKVPSPDLAKIVGPDPLPRTDVVKKLWDYIKENGLQKGRVISPDEDLAAVLGKDPIDMMQMQRHLSGHLT